MGIYNTNAYSPLGAIQAGIANVNEKNRIKDNYWKNWGNTWANTVSEIGKIAGRTIDGISAYESDPDKAELAKLEEELEEAQKEEIQKQYDAQVAQRKAFDEWAMNPDRLKAYQEEQYRDYRPLMDGYHPITGNPLFGMEDFYRRGGGVY